MACLSNPDAYQNFWKNDMRTVVDFAKRFIDLLKWITADDHRQVIVLNFAYYDFALIQKIYTRFYHIEVKDLFSYQHPVPLM